MGCHGKQRGAPLACASCGRVAGPTRRRRPRPTGAIATPAHERRDAGARRQLVARLGAAAASGAYRPDARSIAAAILGEAPEIVLH